MPTPPRRHVGQYVASGDWSDYWTTRISRAESGKIHVRGYPIEELIEHLSYSEAAFLLLRGELPDERETALFDLALRSGMDQQLISSAACAARYTASAFPDSPVPALASGILASGSVTGSPQEPAEMLIEAVGWGVTEAEAARRAVDTWLERRGAVPGLGHPMHKQAEPRAVTLRRLAVERDGWRQHGRLLDAIEGELERRKGRAHPDQSRGRARRAARRPRLRPAGDRRDRGARLRHGAARPHRRGDPRGRAAADHPGRARGALRGSRRSGTCRRIDAGAAHDPSLRALSRARCAALARAGRPGGRRAPAHLSRARRARDAARAGSGRPGSRAGRAGGGRAGEPDRVRRDGDRHRARRRRAGAAARRPHRRRSMPSWCATPRPASSSRSAPTRFRARQQAAGERATVLALAAGEGATTSLRSRRANPRSRLAIDRPPGSLAQILYTSGTTGHPKGVTHSYASVAAAMGAWATGLRHRSRRSTARPARAQPLRRPGDGRLLGRGGDPRDPPRRRIRRPCSAPSRSTA